MLSVSSFFICFVLASVSGSSRESRAADVDAGSHSCTDCRHPQFHEAAERAPSYIPEKVRRGEGRKGRKGKVVKRRLGWMKGDEGTKEGFGERRKGE